MKKIFARITWQRFFTLLSLAGSLLTSLLMVSSAYAAPPSAGPADACKDVRMLKNVHFAEACYWRTERFRCFAYLITYSR